MVPARPRLQTNPKYNAYFGPDRTKGIIAIFSRLGIIQECLWRSVSHHQEAEGFLQRAERRDHEDQSNPAAYIPYARTS